MLGCTRGVPVEHRGNTGAVGMPHGGGTPGAGMDGALNHGAVSNQLHPGF